MFHSAWCTPWFPVRLNVSMGLNVSLNLTTFIHRTLCALWDYMCPRDWMCTRDWLPHCLCGLDNIYPMRQHVSMGLHVSLKLTAYIHETIFTLWDYMCPWYWMCPWDRLPLFIHSAFIDQVISDHWFHLKLFEFMSSHLDKLTQPSLQSSKSGSIRAIFTTYGMVLIPIFLILFVFNLIRQEK